MKKFGLLVSFTLLISSAAIAGENNKIEANERKGIELESDSTYKFSLSKSCLSFFNLFAPEPTKSDSLKNEERTFNKPLP
jgi:hypothetical protein